MHTTKSPIVKEDLLDKLKRDFTLCFSDLFAKSGKKPDHLGLSDIPGTGLYEGYELIRSMLVYKENETFHILKKMPHQFDCGRVIDLKLKDGVFVDIEWSKKSIKKLHIRSLIKTSLKLSFQKALKTCRELSLRESSQASLKRTRSLEDDIVIDLKIGKTCLDRFQK